jgi:hypothetical protein
MKQVIEASYPLSFRHNDANLLGEHLKHHKSVVLVGMKRVGISNFLRFFLNHESIVPTYIKNGLDQIFVQVDLNDLIERNINAFWTLLLTRVVDIIQGSKLPESVKRQCRKLFVQSIQLKDQFFTVDSLRKALIALIDAGYYPTLFIIRFDRLKDVATHDFLSNLMGLRDAVKGKLSYVFTSYRPLEDLAPDVFKKQFLSIFTSNMYLTPATAKDAKIILETLEHEHHISFPDYIKSDLITVCGGYVQYLQLALIRLAGEKTLPINHKSLVELLENDEQIALQSEELFESLANVEKEVLVRIRQGVTISEDDRKHAEYLWNTGMVHGNGDRTEFFSTLFTAFVKIQQSAAPIHEKEFTKKEHRLFIFLQEHENTLCERETIIDAVWPEHKEFGVSDWAIDRLVARLRSKLKAQGSLFEIQTVVTRGYKLIRKSG